MPNLASESSAGKNELPRFVRDLLATPPHRGEGLNNWFFRIARVLHAFRSREEIVELLYAATHSEPLQRGEIERAVERSRAVAWQPGSSEQAVAIGPQWPPVDREKRTAIVTAIGVELYDLWDLSPIRFDEDDEPHTEEIIDVLFPRNSLLCCGVTKSQFDTKLREDWRGKLASERQFMIPSAMSAIEGVTQDGKRSEHSLANTGLRQYLVIESDRGTIDEQASILLHLSQFAPLTLAVYSGGKSLHGWFACLSTNDQAIEPFMRYAVSLGADPAPWTRSQFVRMPDGINRKNGARQSVFLFQPSDS
jgi:hypothetical protein